MIVTIARVHENVFSGEALFLSVKTTEGDITVLPKHEPIVANLAPGIMTVKTSEGEQKFEVLDGILEVSNNQITTLL